MDPEARRPPFHRPTEGRSGTPLLYKKDDDADRGRTGYNTPPMDGPIAPPTSSMPTLSRRSTMRSRSPATLGEEVARKKYTYAALFLVLSLVAFTVQTELAAYVQKELGWNKAYCMLYLTHGSWSLLWPTQLVIIRLQKRDIPWHVFWRRHVQLIRSTAVMVETQQLDLTRASIRNRASPVRHMIRMTIFITSSLTVAGLSWYIAVNMTSPSDLTAIYNCSAFFAYMFSVPILKEPIRLDKAAAVLVAIVGVLVVAYGDSKTTETQDPDASNRFLGNIIIGVGSVLYGLYEVLYKRFACPPDGCSPGRGMIFANTFGSCIGVFTLLVLWFPLPLLHITGIEPFELPTGNTAWLLFLSVIANAVFAGSFLVLISLTSPVLSSVASLLTIFIVAIVDWIFTGEPLSAGAMFGGILIVVAFAMLSWSTWREMTDNEKNKQADLIDSSQETSDSEGD
jgi:drug/metabolite transporter (DMT)-like permease